MLVHFAPIGMSDYKPVFTIEEQRRLQATFPEGVCDWSKPGVEQQRLSAPRLTF